MTVVAAAVTVVLLALGCWGWRAAPRLPARESDPQRREELVNELRRGALAYLLMAMAIGWILACAVVH
jgi:hypothetical protein